MVSRVTVVTVGITLRRDARGAIPREGKDVRFPQNGVGSNDRLTPLSRWRPLVCRRKQRVFAGVTLDAGVRLEAGMRLAAGVIPL